MDTVDVIDQAYREGVRGAYLAGIGAVVEQQAQADRDEEDRATGAAFRRLVESGQLVDICISRDGRVDLCGDTESSGFCDTLPEAVFKALGAEPGPDA